MIEQWTEVTAKSAKAVAVEMGFDSCEVVGVDAKLPAEMSGAFVPLVGKNANLQFGIVSSRAGQEMIARVILQMEPDEGLEHDEIADAVGEFANCLAGRIKREMRKVDGSLRIGIPVFVDGHVEDIGRSAFKVVRTEMNEFPVAVIVVVATG